jgi:hypothetical protein
MGISKAIELKRTSLSDLITDKLLTGQSVGSSVKQSISEKVKAKAKRITDPVYLANSVAGPLGAALMGKITGRNTEDVKDIIGRESDKSKTAKPVKDKDTGIGNMETIEDALYTKVGEIKRPKIKKDDSLADVAAKMYNVIRIANIEKKQKDEVEKKLRKPREDEKQNWHKELIDAITGLVAVKSDKKDPVFTKVSKEMKGFFKKLLKTLDDLIDALDGTETSLPSPGGKEGDNKPKDEEKKSKEEEKKTKEESEKNKSSEKPKEGKPESKVGEAEPKISRESVPEGKPTSIRSSRMLEPGGGVRAGVSTLAVTVGATLFDYLKNSWSDKTMSSDKFKDWSPGDEFSDEQIDEIKKAKESGDIIPLDLQKQFNRQIKSSQSTSEQSKNATKVPKGESAVKSPTMIGNEPFVLGKELTATQMSSVQDSLSKGQDVPTEVMKQYNKQYYGKKSDKTSSVSDTSKSLASAVSTENASSMRMQSAQSEYTNSTLDQQSGTSMINVNKPNTIMASAGDGGSSLGIDSSVNVRNDDPTLAKVFNPVRFFDARTV